MNLSYEQTSSTNTSGLGSDADVPPAVKHWNWGAFFLTWIWGLSNRVYLSLLWFIPIVGWFLMPFVLGAKGNEWAWKRKRWKSEQHFLKVERYWTIAGVTFFLAMLILTAVIIIIGIFWLGPIIIDFFINNELIRLLLYLFGFGDTSVLLDPTSL